jgi:ribosomal protein S12 methylthiotransferase accessory factor
MLKVPVFKRNLVVRPVGDRLLFLLDEHRHIVLRGKFYVHVARMADGNRSWDDLVAELGSHFSLPTILRGLEEMVTKGYLVERQPEIPDSESAWWDYLGLCPELARRRVAETPVALHCLGDLPDARGYQEALRSYGFRIVDGEADFTLVLTDDYLRPELAQINRRALDTGRPWLLAKPLGVTLWLGPVFAPGRTGCWQCLARRLGDNRQAEAFLQRQSGGEPVRTAVTMAPDTFRCALDLVTLELGKCIVQNENYQGLTGRVTVLDLVALSKTDHWLTRRPQCSACGEETYRHPMAPQPVILQPCKKGQDTAGGHRTQPPGRTLKRLEKHISPITGIVNSLEELSDPDNPLLNTYLAGHNFAMLKDDLFFLSLNLRGRSGGKGVTDFHARASAVCEAIERYCGITSRYAFTTASFRQMADRLGDRVFHPRRLALFSDQQYAQRREWNAAQPETGYHRVPEPFDENRPVAWAGAWSLTRQTMCFVPAAYCFYGHRDPGPICVLADSNGSAAGNTLEEAVLQGLMETVERDAVSLWWYNMIRRPRVDIDSFQEPYAARLLDYYQTIGRELWVLDITSDLAIPTFVGVSRCIDRPTEDIVIGLGAHLDPRVALIRALTEVNQFLPAVLRRKPDGTTHYWFPDREAITWWRTARLADHGYLEPAPGLAARRLQDFPPATSDDLLEEITHCRRLLEATGLEVLAMDMTHPDIELAVAKVIVPGLNHYWRRLGGERMARVPVKMGWRETPLPETRMNPFSIFF